MSIADELRKLQEMHGSGALNDEEFAAAKAAVLSGTAGRQEAGREDGLQEHLEEIRLQNEVARLDREWELERERYMITGRYGQRYVPSRGMSLLGGLVIVAFGIFWTAIAAGIVGGGGGVFGLFPLFGVLFILAGIGVSIYSFAKASQHEQAYVAYQRRRQGLLGGQSDSAED